jgi:hypothetical protein
LTSRRSGLRYSSRPRIRERSLAIPSVPLLFCTLELCRLYRSFFPKLMFYPCMTARVYPYTRTALVPRDTCAPRFSTF